MDFKLNLTECVVVQDAGVCDVLHYDEVAENVGDEVAWWSHLTIQYKSIQYNIIKIQYLDQVVLL